MYALLGMNTAAQNHYFILVVDNPKMSLADLYLALEQEFLGSHLNMLDCCQQIFYL